jgi:drug/metabolite transporter (DMT)-like permease
MNTPLVAAREQTARLSRDTQGLLFGALGVLSFSVTLPATRAAVTGGLDATVVGLGRALVAALLAALILVLRRERWPQRRQWASLAIIASGVVVGFPILSAVALRQLPAAHGAVIVGFLPAATALMAVLRANERPSAGFWLACVLGLLTIIIFAVSAGAGRPRAGDLLLLGAVALGALGYAEGGKLAREMGGWRVICWALVLSAPLLVPVVAVAAARTGLAATPGAWLGFAYVSVVSMLLGFFAWYHGLALGGVARVGQVQLVQPVLTLVWAALLLGETVSGTTVVAALLVIASAALSRRTSVRAAPVVSD